MEIKFELKTGEIETTEWKEIAIEGSEHGETEMKLMPAKAIQNDVKLTDGKNTYLLPRESATKAIIETISEEEYVAIIQNDQLLRRYKWKSNSFTPLCNTAKELVDLLNSEKYLNNINII